MAKVGPNAVKLAIAEMIGQLLTFTTHPIGHKLSRGHWLLWASAPIKSVEVNVHRANV